MLESVHIRNFAVVERLDLWFGPGLNVVTGETGAGKSLILGALQLLLGERADRDLIRRGEAQCELTAAIRLTDAYPDLEDQVRHLLTELGADGADENGLILRRVLTANGTRNFVNDAPVTLQALRRLGDLLIDIHGPHDHQSLLAPRCQMELLDAFGGLGAERARVAELFAAFREAEDRLHAARAETVEESELAFLRDLVQRVDKADLREGEDEDLRTEYEVLANGRRLLELAGACEQGLGDTDGTPLAMLSSLYSVLQEVADLDPERGGGFLAQLEEAMTSLQELGADLGTYAEQVDLDQQRLGEVEERLDLINRLKRRHGPTIEDVLARAEQARETLARADDRTRRLAELEQDLSRCERLCREAARHLHEQREAATGGLADAIEAKLKRLSFVQSLFRVELTEAPLSPAGCDRVEFCFSPNPGEGTRPLRQIASSGEMARVMLAVKTVLSEADQIPILVFDEVDANIGGRVAGTVAEEMRGIAGRHQVLCVTHQPQIAAAGQHHFRVQKSVAGDRTRTEVVRIEGQERLLEITRMLGAETTSDTAQAHARELLTQDWSPSPVQGLDRT